VKINLKRLTLGAAGLIAGLASTTCFDDTASAASYYGNARWCAVVDRGAGSIIWECEYDTVEQCVPNVIAGNRGFCQHNPYWQGGNSPPPPRHRHRKQY
jgi:hypothetical protein